MSTRIKPAKKTDIKAWAAMRHELWPHASVKELGIELADLLKHRQVRGWFALEKGLPVGFAEASVRDFANGCKTRPVAFLEGIWVRKSHRGQGIGRRLVKAVEEWARKKGLRELASDTNLKCSVSRICHRRWGFRETEQVVYFRKRLRKGR